VCAALEGAGCNASLLDKNNADPTSAAACIMENNLDDKAKAVHSRACANSRNRGRELDKFVHGEHLLYKSKHGAGRKEVDCRSKGTERLSRLQGLEAVLGPGDVVLFGPMWCHYAVSETASASVTCRFSHTNG
jgi:hypothetical protein